jgi:hypothetical protein
MNERRKKMDRDYYILGEEEREDGERWKLAMRPV